MIKVRASKILIEIPKEGAEPWISITVERIEHNGDIVNTVSNYDRFNRRSSDLAKTRYGPENGFAPSTHIDDGTFSFEDVSNMISIIVIGWLVERYNGTVDEHGNVLLES